MSGVIICGVQPGPLDPPRRTDPLQVLIDLCEAHCEDFLISNGGGDPNVPRWYALGYFYAPHDIPPEDGRWEIDVQGQTMREVLCAFIADPRFGQ